MRIEPIKYLLQEAREFVAARKAEISERISQGINASWRNPSDERIFALVLLEDAAREWREEHPWKVLDHMQMARKAYTKWREENPEEVLTILEKAWNGSRQWREENAETIRSYGQASIAMGAKWRQENPEKFFAHLEEITAAAAKWRQENPEKAAAITKKLHAGHAKWREENPEKFAAISKKAEKARIKKYAQRYSEWLRIIKTLIPESGVVVSDLCKLGPQWSYNQMRHFLRIASQRGDLAREVINSTNARYYLPGRVRGTSSPSVQQQPS